MSDLSSRITQLSPKRLALLALELDERLAAVERTRQEPIAIVGMACRFPGGAASPESFWRLLRDGADAIREVPGDRWDIDALYDPNPDAPGRMSTRWGGFVDGWDQFDPHFFGISPREALTMDPQQRMLLEVAWEALERGGQAPERLHGSATAVFAGVCNGDYGQLLMRRDLSALDAYFASGNAFSVLAGRLSYILGFQGPAVAVDTACSSSLVAVHLACQSLRQGECRMAVAAGVNYIGSPEVTVALSKAHMMAPDGRCKTFDASADGFVRGEGCGVVVLKRLSDADADGDTVLAVIRGTASNQDGRSGGLTAPNGPSQEAVIAAALANAGVRPEEIDYVEAHGTGTSLGDPIEVRAIGRALASGRTKDNPVAIGSVKTNIGHLESAAGVAGLMKVVLSLQHELLPRHLHFNRPNPHIEWEEMPVAVITAERGWKRGDRRRIAGVSSFGFSGTNAHVVIEEAPVTRLRASAADRPDRPAHVLTVSARSEAALRQLADAFADRLGEAAASELGDICYTANAGRSHFAHRLALAGTTGDDVALRLRGWAAGSNPTGLAVGEAPTEKPDAAFLFTGQGSQYVGMAQQLYETEPTFRRTLDRCDEILRGHLPVPLTAVMFDASAPLDDTAFTQPALFAVEYALAELWRSWGVEPAAVMGHSVGEFVAACVAGVMTLEDALRLIAARGRLMSALPGGGRMAAIFAPIDAVESAIAPHRDRVAVAAVNGPDHVVISGAGEAVETICAAFAARGARTQALAVSHAFHSPLMQPVVDAFRRDAQAVRFSSPTCAYVSNLTGRVLAPGEVPDAEYWCRHIMEPVQFAASIRTLFSAGHRVFLEVGPNPTLLGMGRHCVAREDVAWVPSLRKGKDDWSQLLEAVGALYTRGLAINWEAFDAERGRQRVVLPTYPFQRQRYWAVERSGVDARRSSTRRQGREVHPLLGTRLDTPIPSFESEFNPHALPVLRDHRVRDLLVVPGPVYIEMAAAAAAEILGAGSVTIEQFAIREPLVVGESSTRRVHTTFTTSSDRQGSFQVFSSVAEASDAAWTLHATGTVRVEREATTAGGAEAPALVRARCSEEIDGGTFVANLKARDVNVAAGQAIERIWRRDGEAIATLASGDADVASGMPYRFDPAVLDAAMLILGAAGGHGARAPEGTISVLAGIDAVRLHAQPAARLSAHVVIDRADASGVSATLRLLNDDGAVVAELTGMRVRHVQPRQLASDAPRSSDDWLYDVAWRAAGALPSAEPAAAYLADPSTVAAEIEPSVERLWREHDLDRYTHVLPSLERMCAGYAAAALRELGAPATGILGSSAALRRQLGVADRHQRLFDRLLQMLAEDGALACARGEWSWAGTPASADPDGIAADLIARHPPYAPHVRLTAACGRQLAPVLRGVVDPLHLLFPGGSFAATEHLYEHSPSAHVYNALVKQAIATAVAALPAGRTLRCLEIGAGTGGTTSAVLPALPAERTEYHYTDLSKLFMSRAAEKFRRFPFVRYSLLDIEQDPIAQGYQPQSFDLVVASNVVHATARLRDTFQNIERLLAPDGVVMLVEGTEVQRWVDLTFGLLEGWWKFADRDVRPSYPLLSKRRWQTFLSEAGFSDVVAVPAREDAPQAIVMARGPAAVVERDAGHDAVRRSTILVGDPAVTAPMASVLRRVNRDVESCATADDLAAALSVVGKRACDVVHVRSLSVASRDHGGEPLADVMDAVGDVPSILRRVVAAAADVRLWIATVGAQMVDAAPRPLAAAQAPAWGLGRVIALEQPEHWGGLIDLDPLASTEQHALAIADLLSTGDDEDQIAVRDGATFVPRIVRSAPVPAGEAPIRGDGAYLVTGGLGGLGLKVGRWLVDRGARHLVLMGRRGLPERATWPDLAPSDPARRAVDAVRDFETAGATVEVVKGDAADSDAMASLFATFGTARLPLRGIVHTAVQMSAWPVRDLDAAALGEMLRAKVSSTWLLHELSRAHALDFFVMFSSTTALWGVAGLGHYAAANLYMDALARDRRARGLPALSVNWGTWDEMRVATAADQQAIAQAGMLPMTSCDALDVLGDLVASGTAQKAVASIDWSMLKPVYEARRERPFFREIAGRPAVSEGRSGVADRLVGELREAPPAERRERLVAYLRGEVADVLGLAPGASIALGQGLFEMGMDSLMSVELKSRLERGLAYPLPSTLTFNYPNIGALAAFIEAEVLGSASAETVGRTAVAPTDASVDVMDEDDREDLSEDELAGLLAERLNRLSR